MLGSRHGTLGFPAHLSHSACFGLEVALGRSKVDLHLPLLLLEALGLRGALLLKLVGLPCRLLLEALLSHRGIALQLHALLHAGGLELALLQLSLMPELRV